MTASARVWHRVAGRSMWPLTAPAQVALDDQAASVQVGDIVGVVAGPVPAIVLHRVEIIDGDRVILRGDTRDRQDPPVARSAIVGRLSAVRWGAIEIAVPCSGPIGAVLRAAGRTWAMAAPSLRACLRSCRQARANVDTR